MGELKYKYAFDEKGDIISIENLTKETSKNHTFKCIVCGSELRPRAIGSKYRRAHFYHKGVISCNEETYIHKLCKLFIKQYFYNSDSFKISYEVSKSCKEHNCNLKNYNCHKEHEINQVDLKEFYDTCTIEAPIKGFVADLLLTNSKDTSIPPTLIEICVTHPCEDEKKESGLKIIEISIKTEKDIENLFSDGFLSENLNKRIGNKIEFISFKRNIEEKLVSSISRFIYYPALSPTPFKNNIQCSIANRKIFKESIVELNVVSANFFFSDNQDYIAYDWLVKHLKLRRCDQCKYNYSINLGKLGYCRLSKKYGKPAFPEINYAEICNCYRKAKYSLLYSENSDYRILEVTNEQTNTKETYNIIIAVSNGFKDDTLFENKCNHFLAKKIKTHNINILFRTADRKSSIINWYSYRHNLITIPFDTEWEKYGENAGNISNEKMINCANAVIAFWDGKSKFTKNLIDMAKAKGLPTVVVRI